MLGFDGEPFLLREGGAVIKQVRKWVQMVMQNDRENGNEALAVEQQTALELLLLGKSVAETAKTAGVGRSTVHRWLKHDPAFRAAYNEWHDQLKESSRSRLLMLTDKATDALEKALEAGDARAALQLLKGMGLIKDQPAGPTEPEEVKKVMEIEKERRKIELRKAKGKLSNDAATADLGW
jgi:DNA-directed RNA polymerase specialized sigma24 family protein